jgi:formylmethanofuran dehydrogenase subunit E
MGDVLAFKKSKAAANRRAGTLCRRGFHKWRVVDTPFDSKQGRLLTRYRCERCGEEKVEAHSR